MSHNKLLGGIGCAACETQKMKVLFDSAHGQKNWIQTGFYPRQMSSTFSGLAKLFQELGFSCMDHRDRLVSAYLTEVQMLVIPSPTGHFNDSTQQWERDESSLFTPPEIGDILSFLESGGGLVAFTYRFGDSFTKTNLRELTAALGCILNDDVIVDLELLRNTRPFHTSFQTPADCIVQDWARNGVSSVVWRPVSSFTMIVRSPAQPVVLSPKNCVSVSLDGHRISHESVPICVAGKYGKGAYMLFGGPQAFESSVKGFLDLPGNIKFMSNTLNWLIKNTESYRLAETSFRSDGHN